MDRAFTVYPAAEGQTDVDAIMQATPLCRCTACDLVYAEAHHLVCPGCAVVCGYFDSAAQMGGGQHVWRDLRLELDRNGKPVKLGEGGFGLVLKCSVLVPPKIAHEKWTLEMLRGQGRLEPVRRDGVLKLPRALYEGGCLKVDPRTGHCEPSGKFMVGLDERPVYKEGFQLPDVDAETRGTMLSAAQTAKIAERMVRDFRDEIRMSHQLMLSAEHVRAELKGELSEKPALLRHAALVEAAQATEQLHATVAGWRYINRMIDFAISPLPCLVFKRRQQTLCYADRQAWGNVRDGATERLRCCAHQVLNGLLFMHSAGLAHMDVKPDNVLFDAVRGPNGEEILRCYLSDFGLSCASERTDSRDGTKRYKAPELLDHSVPIAKVVPKYCDAFSFAAMLLVLLFPIEGDTDQDSAELAARAYVDAGGTVAYAGHEVTHAGLKGIAADISALALAGTPAGRYNTHFLPLQKTLAPFAPELLAGGPVGDDAWEG